MRASETTGHFETGQSPSVKNCWRKAICTVLSLVITLSGALTATAATTIVDIEAEEQAEHRHVIVEVIKKRCDGLSKRDRTVTCFDCFDGCESRGNTADCSLCLYCPVEAAFDFGRLPASAVPERSAHFASIIVFPPTRPPTR